MLLFYFCPENSWRRMLACFTKYVHVTNGCLKCWLWDDTKQDDKSEYECTSLSCGHQAQAAESSGVCVQKLASQRAANVWDFLWENNKMCTDRMQSEMMPQKV